MLREKIGLMDVCFRKEAAKSGMKKTDYTKTIQSKEKGASPLRLTP
jgi:hypothetical protein